MKGIKKIQAYSLATFLLLTACGHPDKEAKDDPSSSAVKDTIVVSPKDSLPLNFEDTLSTVVTEEGPKEVLLRFNLQKGNTYGYNIDMDLSQQVQDRKINTGMNWQYSLVVMNESKGIKLVRVTYDRIAMSMNMGEQKMEFSSDAPAGDASNPLNMVNQLFSSMKGKSFTMTVDPKGEIREVKGLEELGEGLVAGLNLSPELKQRMLRDFQSKFNANNVKETFSQTFSMLPGKKIKPGDSWKKESETSVGPAKGRLAITYTVQSITGNLVRLSGKGELLSKDGKAIGTQHSRLTIDATTGLVLQNVFNMNTVGPNQVSTHGSITGKKL